MGKKSYPYELPVRVEGLGHGLYAFRRLRVGDKPLSAAVPLTEPPPLPDPPPLPGGRAGENLIDLQGFYSVKAKYLMLFAAIDMNNLCKEGQSCCCVVKIAIVN